MVRASPKNNAMIRERVSPSRPGFRYDLGRIGHPDVLLLDEEDRRRAEASVLPFYIPKSGRRRKQDPRELINAYGNHRAEEAANASFYEKLPKAPRFDVDATSSESAARCRRFDWKQTDEDDDDDEFAWESMSPTLPDKSSANHSWPAFYKHSAAAEPSFTIQDKIAPLLSHNVPIMKYRDDAGDAVMFNYMLPKSAQMKLYAMPQNQGAHQSMFMPRQQCNVSGTHQNQQSQKSILPPSLAPHSTGQHMNNHPGTLGHGVDVSSVLPSSSALYSRTDASLQSHHNRSLAPSPASPQNVVSSVSCPTSGFSSLIASLMDQGLISLESPPAKPQDILGSEFNMDLVNVRNDSVITGLYSGLPRQCATCGLRFRIQEDHSGHMDWHVAKNRTSKGRKEKPSRHWYATTKEWLSIAELVGNDAVLGHLPTESSVVEKSEEKDIAVPADDDFSSCSLCGEAFEDFYSDELEEWLYRGAMYLNAPNGYVEGLDRSQLGPIIHVKCKPEENKCSG